MNELNSLEDVTKMFYSEKIALDYIRNIRWGKWAKCPYCDYDKTYLFKDGKRLKCANPICKKQFSTIVRTMFMNSNMKADQWMQIFYLYSKTRGRINSFQLCSDAKIAPTTEFFVREKIEFVWKRIEREGKSNLDLIDDLIKKFCFYYDSWMEIKNAPYYAHPYHISNIDNIADQKQYNQLLRYTKYYITVYAHWIFLDFASPEDILAETFLYMRDNGIKDYGGTEVIKYVQKTVGKMWYEYLNQHPKYHTHSRLSNLRWKREAVMNLKNNYIIEILFKKKGNKLSRTQLSKDTSLIDSERKRIISKRKKNNKNYEFNSHF